MTVSLLMLGTGTSQGVPAIGCACDTCRSSDYRDRRLRPSVLFTVNDVRILIDTSTDFRQQMLMYQVPYLNAVLYTHHHIDHIGGFDDLRQYNFIQKSSIPVYGLKDTINELAVTFRYAFGAAKQKGGGVPLVDRNEIIEEMTFTVSSVPVTPLPAMHGCMKVLGYRIGDIAYLTDVNAIPESTFEHLRNLDVLVLDALRHSEHPTHFSLTQAIATAENIEAKRTFFTHIAHNIMHERDSALLPETMKFSYDGLVITSGDDAS